MLLHQLQLKHFRCFEDTTLIFDGSLVLIKGLNGAGKTSLLEALHYLCYLRSFRTHTPRELLKDGKESFFVRAQFSLEEGEGAHELQVGFSGARRLVKLNQKTVSTHKELMDHYRIVTLTEDDLELIKGSPEVRRSFIDQVVLLEMPEVATKLRMMRHVADSRNRFLQGQSGRDRDLYRVLTEQLWTISQEIQQIRCAALERLGKAVSVMLERYTHESLEVAFIYKPKIMLQGEGFEEFLTRNGRLKEQEDRFRRSLFGAHLDDIDIRFADKQSRRFASRGQQKLIVVLLKIAQLQELAACKGAAVFLLDDFMTDFDEGRAQVLLDLLADLKTQLIFTCPAQNDFLESWLERHGGQRLLLTA